MNIETTRSHIRHFLFVYAALMTLLAITVGSAFIEMGIFNSMTNIGIAVAKTLLIIIFFMHLSSASSLIRLFATAGFFWLIILFSLTMSDYLTRPSGRSADFPTIEESASALEPADGR